MAHANLVAVDARGHFVVENLPPGTYEISVVTFDRIEQLRRTSRAANCQRRERPGSGGAGRKLRR